MTKYNNHDQVSCPKEFSKDSYLQGVFRQYGYDHNQLFVFICQYLQGIVMKYKGHNGPIFWKPKDIYDLMIKAGFKINKNLIEIEKVKIKPALGLKKICKNPGCLRPFIANYLGMDFCYWCMNAKIDNLNK